MKAQFVHANARAAHSALTLDRREVNKPSVSPEARKNSGRLYLLTNISRDGGRFKLAP